MAPTVSLIVPAFNEAATIETVLGRVADLPWDHEVIVGDDGSFAFEAEVTAKLLRLPGVRLYEVPISYYGRTFAEGKKIHWHDGLVAVATLLRYRVWR